MPWYVLIPLSILTGVAAVILAVGPDVDLLWERVRFSFFRPSTWKKALPKKGEAVLRVNKGQTVALYKEEYYHVTDYEVRVEHLDEERDLWYIKVRKDTHE